MSQPSAESNPYAPARLVDESEELVRHSTRADALVGDDYQPASVRWVVTRWSLVCTIAAGPSFFFGVNITNGQVAGMCLGIVIFIALYIATDLRTADAPWRRWRSLRRTLTTLYTLRVAISILFPVGAVVDMFCGMFSVTISSAILNLTNRDWGSSQPLGFVASLLTTLIQGVVLNFVLAAVGLLLFPLIAYFSRRAPPIQRGVVPASDGLLDTPTRDADHDGPVV